MKSKELDLVFFLILQGSQCCLAGENAEIAAICEVNVGITAALWKGSLPFARSICFIKTKLSNCFLSLQVTKVSKFQ